MENSERYGNTRPPDLPLEKSVCTDAAQKVISLQGNWGFVQFGGYVTASQGWLLGAGPDYQPPAPGGAHSAFRAGPRDGGVTGEESPGRDARVFLLTV